MSAPAYDYRFETRWRVRGSPEEVTDILSDAPGLVRWWPRVYLAVRETEPGVFALLTRGWLPYKLRWSFRLMDSHHPYGFSLRAWGDLEGTGTWSFERDGDWTIVRYSWEVRAQKPLLHACSWLLKPVFSANHRWAMAQGQESLARELERRHLRA